jgi:hypothetical protein
MGHKGVSKRKPKKPNSSIEINTASKTRLGENPSVQSLVKDKDAPLNRGAANLYTGSHKKDKKDKR